MTKPVTSAWSSSSSSASVPNRLANTPPRSMSPTTIVGSPAVPGQAHVHEVAVAQVDLGRAAGAFADHDVVLGALSSVVVSRRRSRRADRRRLAKFAAPIVAFASPSTMTWLVWSLPGLSSTGLKRTSPASPHAAACMAWARPISPPRAVRADHDGRVVRHVLRLERCDVHAPAMQPTADAGGQNALAGVGRGAGDEEAAHFLGLTAATTAAAATAARPTFRESLAARRMCRWSGLGPSPRNGRVSVRPK